MRPRRTGTTLSFPAAETIQAQIASGEAPLIGEADPELDSVGETERGIIRIIDEEIRPAVALDGGDITFASYEDGVVRLFLRGSCSGCPSSLATLKMVIERRLQEEFLEITAVEAAS